VCLSVCWCVCVPVRVLVCVYACHCAGGASRNGFSGIVHGCARCSNCVCACVCVRAHACVSVRTRRNPCFSRSAHEQEGSSWARAKFCVCLCARAHLILLMRALLAAFKRSLTELLLLLLLLPACSAAPLLLLISAPLLPLAWAAADELGARGDAPPWLWAVAGRLPPLAPPFLPFCCHWPALRAHAGAFVRVYACASTPHSGCLLVCVVCLIMSKHTSMCKGCACLQVGAHGCTHGRPHPASPQGTKQGGYRHKHAAKARRQKGSDERRQKKCCRQHNSTYGTHTLMHSADPHMHTCASVDPHLHGPASANSHTVHTRIHTLTHLLAHTHTCMHTCTQKNTPEWPGARPCPPSQRREVLWPHHRASAAAAATAAAAAMTLQLLPAPAAPAAADACLPA